MESNKQHARLFPVYLSPPFLLSTPQDAGSVSGVAVSTAANFIASALYGRFAFSEEVPPLFVAGLALVLAGIFLLSKVEVRKKEEEGEANNKKKDE